MRPSLIAGALRARLAFAVGLAVASAACASSPTAVAVPALGLTEGRTADVAPRWNALARTLIVTAKPNQQEALRALAYLSLAQHEAALEATSSAQGGGTVTAGLGLTSESTEIVSVSGESNAQPVRVDRNARLR